MQLQTLTTTSLTTEELHLSISTLEAERDEIIGRLKLLRATKESTQVTKPTMSKAEEDLLDKREKHWHLRHERRNRIATDMWNILRDAVAEVDGITEEELRERFCLDD